MELNQWLRYSSWASKLTYNFPLSTGSYQVVLHFAEIYFTAADKRLFDVYIEGSKVLSNYDIVARAGSFAAIKESFVVNVGDGVLNIEFNSLSGKNAMVLAIELLPNTTTVNMAAKTIPLAVLNNNQEATAGDVLQIQAFPNPSSDRTFNIRLNVPLVGPVFYSLVSSRGSVFMNGKRVLRQPTSNLNFNFSELMKVTGMYYLKLEGKNQKGTIRLMRIRE